MYPSAQMTDYFYGSLSILGQATGKGPVSEAVRYDFSSSGGGPYGSSQGSATAEVAERRQSQSKTRQICEAPGVFGHCVLGKTGNF